MKRENNLSMKATSRSDNPELMKSNDYGFLSALCKTLYFKIC